MNTPHGGGKVSWIVRYGSREVFMSRSSCGMSSRDNAGNLALRIALSAAAIAVLLFAGCQTVLRRDMSNDLVPAEVAGFSTSIHDERYHTATTSSGLDIVIREDVSGYANFTIWVTNNSGQRVDFPATLSTLSARSRDGHGTTYLPMGMELYLEKVLKCYYEKDGYEEFKDSVRKNYLKDTTIEPGKTAAGILRYEIAAERADNYTLRLHFGEREVSFRYMTPRQ